MAGYNERGARANASRLIANDNIKELTDRTHKKHSISKYKKILGKGKVRVKIKKLPK